MSTTAEPTLQQVLDIARRLSPRDRAQLIATLVIELAELVETLQAAASEAANKPTDETTPS